MGLDPRPQTTTAEQYAQIFASERAKAYPSVDAFEAKMGFSLDRDRLESAARVLSCPFKAAAPNWQHGRVIYAAVRSRIQAMNAAGWSTGYAHVDIGTAKGFSALCALWAIEDSQAEHASVESVDVLPQSALVRRNTVAEVDRLCTLSDVLAPWPETARIRFHESTGIDFLKRSDAHVHSAFVDGKHSTEAVSAEWKALAKRQASGDIAIFDDVQMPAVAAGLKGADYCYTFERLDLGSVNRSYVIGVRR